MRREGMRDQHALDSDNAQSSHWMLMYEPYFVALGLSASPSKWVVESGWKM
jgi:hypothetical protein